MPKLKANRASFVLWASGIIMEFHRGKGVVTDHLNDEYEKLRKEMDNGRTLWLTNAKGKVVSRMRLTEKGYEEFPCVRTGTSTSSNSPRS